MAATLILTYSQRIAATTNAYYASTETSPDGDVNVVKETTSLVSEQSSSPPVTELDAASSLGSPTEFDSLHWVHGNEPAMPEIDADVQDHGHQGIQIEESGSSPALSLPADAVVVSGVPSMETVQEPGDSLDESAATQMLSIDAPSAIIIESNETIAGTVAIPLTPEEKAELERLAAQKAAENAILWTEIRKPFFDSSRIAVIVEDRPLNNLVPLMLHFSSVLGPEWPVVLFTRSQPPPGSAPLKRALAEKRIFIQYLPEFVEFKDHASVSQFLTTPWLWNQLAPAKHVLMFQSDSIICSNAEQSIEDFVQYDFVGAPIHSNYGHGYNGGLSLRNRTMILDIIHESSFNQESSTGQAFMTVSFEDQWFYNKMVQLPANADGTPAANLPMYHVAMNFAVETIDYDFPLGYHQVDRWQKKNIKHIEDWCPEVRLCTSKLLVNHNKSAEQIAAEEAEIERKAAVAAAIAQNNNKIIHDAISKAQEANAAAAAPQVEDSPSKEEVEKPSKEEVEQMIAAVQQENDGTFGTTA